MPWAWIWGSDEVKRSDSFRLLGLRPDATQDQIRAAFREKVRQTHPDTGAGDREGPGVEEIVEAYRILSDISLRDTALSGNRIQVRQRGRPSQDSNAAAPSCPECRGTGELRQETICPECKGRTQITSLDGERGRVVWCRRCSGAGTVLASQPCRACSGTGAIP